MSIYFAYIFFKMASILLVRFRLRSRAHFMIGLMILYNLLQFGWLIYGNRLYFSNANTCNTIEETRGMASMMLFFLFMGYPYFIMVAVLICVIPCIAFAIYEEEERRKSQMIQITASL